MSGERPNGFEIHSSDDGADIITARDFSHEIHDWFGKEGILDMRAYVRFRFLEYFKDQLLPNGLIRVFRPAVSEEEMAINTLVIDFAMKHEYYFTLCLLISEIQAFSKFDERLKPLLTKISSMSTDEMENLTPLLDREQVSWVLRTFKIDPGSENGLNINQAYQLNEKRRSLIQLLLSYSNGNNCYVSQNNIEVDKCVANATVDNGNDFNAMIEGFTNLITHMNRRVKKMEFKISQSGLEMRHGRRTKAIENDVKRLKGKFADISKMVDEMRSNSQLLMQLVNHIRLQGQRALQRCSPYIGHILALTSHISRIEVAVRRMRRKLTAQCNRSKAHAIKRRHLKIRKMATEYSSSSIQNDAANLLNKSVQTEKCSDKISLPLQSCNKTNTEVAVQTNPVITVDAYTQSEFVICKYTNQEIMPVLTYSNGYANEGIYNGDSLILAKQPKQEEGETSLVKVRLRDNSVQTVMSSYPWQGTPIIMEQNSELHAKVLEQSRRINYLTIRLAQLQADMAEKETSKQPYHMCRDRTDASTNTDACRLVESTGVTSVTDCKLGLSVHQKVARCEPNPLKKALLTAKAEIGVLKREMRNIQNFSQSNS